MPGSIREIERHLGAERFSIEFESDHRRGDIDFVWHGVMERETGSPSPDRFPSQPGGVFPVFHLLAALAGFERAAPVVCEPPRHVAALLLISASGRRRLVLANLTSDALVLHLRLPEAQVQARILDGTSFIQAMRDPEGFRGLALRELGMKAGGALVAMSAYALVFVDMGLEQAAACRSQP